ncbi:PREDICTED: uncharacterized protein LOC108377061 [Rhagoletis zephyria]|uniref:uncharacterized protein LOC108364367 n=1 Tax=Rhagoletis zephyria TaxID=28612 RepID=UPI00081189F3|nr:PREDICTED: uncharacterized protein LOC108364367 [Rhagoletis zephyria]XP_017488817.1 PREDICTED: uncharacterized protein LOC108377061 [Rhagoletis zephyria]
MFANNEINHVRPILYYDDINPHSRAVLMILNMLNVDVELRAVEMIKGEHLKPAYAKINPAGTVPTMVHKELIVTDNAIFAYVCENHGNDKAKQLIAFNCYKRHCRILSRLFFESQVLHRIHGQLMTDLVRKTIYETDVDYHQKKVENAYDVMESYLKDGEYMAGSVLTAADISFAACLGALDMMFPIEADRKRWEKLNDWFRCMRSLPVHKINTNGIEKQRRVVEYFAKFRFAGDVRLYTTGVRDSLVPQFTETQARCSIGVQTNTAQQTDFSDQFSADDVLQRNRMVENSAKDLEVEIFPQTAVIDLLKEIPALELTALSSEKDDTQSAPKQSPATLNNPHPPEDRLVPEPVIIPAAQTETSTIAERSFGGEQKEKPPVPPRRKRNRTIVMTALDVNGKNSDNEPIEDPRGGTKEKPITATLENQKNKDTLESKNNNLSRLNGGVEPIVPPEPPVSACPLTAVNKTSETIKEAGKNSLPIPAKPPTTRDEKMKTSSEPKPNANDKNKATKIPILPPGSPINGQQVALQYTRGSYASAAPSLVAPPPTPNNSSQDVQNDFEFPPPPSEVSLQNSRACCKAVRATKLIVSNKVNAESIRKTVVKKASGFARTDNSKVLTDSVTKTAAKKSTDVKPIADRNSAVTDNKKFKLVKKTRLIASGTKSPSSHISIASLGNNKAGKVQKPSKETNTAPKLIRAATGRPVTKSQDRKIQKLGKGGDVKVVKSSGATVNGCKSVKGGSLNSTGTVRINTKPTEKKRRVEGGGHWRSKEKAPSVDMHSKILDTVLKEPKTVEVKPAGLVQKLEANSTPPNTTTAEGKAASQITTKAVKKQLKPASQALSSKNKVNVYPAKITGDNKTKTTKILNTRPLVVGVTASNKSQPNVDTVKRAVIKIKKKRGKVPSVAQSLPLETPCASIKELKCVVGQNRIQQNASSATLTPDYSTPETTTGKTSQALAVSAANRIVQSPNEAGHILPTNPFPLAGKREEVTFSALKEVPAKVGLVAKTMQTLAAATPNFRPPAINILKVLSPKPYPLSPPLLPFHHKLPPPPLPNLSPNDGMPQAGTVAKALQFLSAVTSEANPLCGAVKPFRKAALKIKSMEQPASAVVNNGVEEAVDA